MLSWLFFSNTASAKLIYYLLTAPSATLRYRELGTEQIGIILRFCVFDRSLLRICYQKDVKRDLQNFATLLLASKMPVPIQR